MTVGNEQIDVPVVVIIEKLQAPAAHQPRQTSKAHRSGEIIESKVVTVVVDRIHFLIDVCDE